MSDAAERLTGHDVGGLLRRAQFCLESSRYDEALRLSGQVLAASPDEPDAWCVRAIAHLNLDDPQAALDAARRAAAADPDGEWAHRLMSLALSRLGRHEEAVEAARRAVRLSPDQPLVHVQLSRAACEVPAMRREAWDAATTAVELDPQEPLAHVAVGDVATAVKDWRTAERAYREALRLDPGHVVARHQLAVLKVGRGRLVDAAEGFAAVGAADPSIATVPGNLRVVVLTWLQRVHWGLWVVWWVIYRLIREEPEGLWVTATGVVSLIGLALLVWWTRRTVGVLRAPLRRAVWQVLRTSWVTKGWFFSLALASVILLVVAWVPDHAVRFTGGTVAGAAVVIGCLISWSPALARRLRRR